VRVRRRRLLSVGAGTFATAFAGCTDGGTTEDTDTDGAATDSETPIADGELDLREANVTGVESETDGGDHRFSVTLIHDDDGEDGYANWWQVETLDGERLGRRDLAHPHGTREFTRSETISLPERVECVVVRGHDRTHGYGGHAMLHHPDSGNSRVVRQGREPETFADAGCP